MQKTKTLDRIIDKIVDSKPARLDGKRRVRSNVATVRPNEVASNPDGGSQRAVGRREPPRRPALVSTPRETREFAVAIAKTEISAPTIRRSAPRSFDETRRPASAEPRSFGEPRAKTPRRRQIDPTTCERDYSADEIEFMKALDDYKRSSGRMFPTCSEILEVFKSLGYAKVAAPAPEPTVRRVARAPRTSTPAFLSDGDEDGDVKRFDLSGARVALSFA